MEILIFLLHQKEKQIVREIIVNRRRNFSKPNYGDIYWIGSKITIFEFFCFKQKQGQCLVDNRPLSPIVI